MSFINPLHEASIVSKAPSPCVLVIFGATGDLTARRLVPALYNLSLEKQLPGQFVCIGFARRDKSHEDFRREMRSAIEKFSRIKPVEDALWKNFSERLFYHRSEFDHDEGYESLSAFLQQIDGKFGTKGNRIFYLSTQPSFFPLIVEKLHHHHLIADVNKEKTRWTRVIIEKPFGRDLESAISLQQKMCQHLDESQIYRIDHYLGKETVQNLLVFRFANSIFESVWNNNHIDHVQISVAEDLGVGTRGNFFEEAGMLRDIVQNHMMQLLSLTAMEPPISLNADDIRDEKTKVLESIRPIKHEEMDKYVVRGQYDAGFINGEQVVSYRDEDNVAKDSSVETYVAMQLFIDNWRWSGIPFYLRAGKRLPKRATEIAITFKEAPGVFFQQEGHAYYSNVLAIRIQPNEGISLKINCKVPGLTSPIQPVKMDFRYGSYFGTMPPEAYERLICDSMIGDSTLFARNDEVTASWRFITPILQHWEEHKPSTFPNYQAGTWGPQSADLMLTRENRQWRLV